MMRLIGQRVNRASLILHFYIYNYQTVGSSSFRESLTVSLLFQDMNLIHTKTTKVNTGKRQYRSQDIKLCGFKALVT